MSLISRFGKRTRQVKPWMTVALALAMLLAGYYAIWGQRLLGYLGAERALSPEINQLSAILGRPPKDLGPVEGELETAEEKLKAASSVFVYEQSDHVIRLVTDAANDAGLRLDGVAAAAVGAESVGNVRYVTQPVDLWVSGSLAQILSFLSLLDQRAATVDIVKVGLRNSEDTIGAEIRIVKHYSPEYVAGKATKP